MEVAEEFRQRARATWASGDWDRCSLLIAPVGAVVLERIALDPGMSLLDVGTGNGGNVAIPAAQRGARVVGADVTPALFVSARRRAAAAGVEVEWVEADAQDLPFADASFDRVTSTFGAMFAPDHRRAAAELVRVCRPGGRIVMTTWVNGGFAAELFRLTDAALPPPPSGVEPPTLWGIEEHVQEVFGAAGVTPSVVRETVQFGFTSPEEAVRRYAEDFGPFVTTRAVLEPLGRWDGFLEGFAEVVDHFSAPGGPGTFVAADYFVVTVEP